MPGLDAMNATTELRFAAMRHGLPLLELRDRLRLSGWPGRQRRWPVSGPLADGAAAPFFILGSPRSGTTLTRAIVQGHHDIYVPPENGTLGSIVKTFSLVRGESWDVVVGHLLDEFALGYEFDHWDLRREDLEAAALALPTPHRSLAGFLDLVYRAYGARRAAGKRRWGDKSTPGTFHYLYRLSRVFPGARYLHIVRDGRACVASSIRAGFYDGDYLTAARAWQFNVRACRRLGARIGAGRYQEIRYEDLVARPEETVTRICAFLGVDVDPAMLAHSDDIAARVPEITDLSHHDNVGRPLFASSVERWREDVPPPVLAMLQRKLAHELSAYGYD